MLFQNPSLSAGCDTESRPGCALGLLTLIMHSEQWFSDAGEVRCVVQVATRNMKRVERMRKCAEFGVRIDFSFYSGTWQ